MTKKPHGRPNEMEPALIVYARDTGSGGFTLPDAAQGVPSVAAGRRTYRALSMAAQRLVDKGILRSVREGLRYRFWHSDV